eukprot:7999991-Pyramimonas_sp.AAC.1
METHHVTIEELKAAGPERAATGRQLAAAIIGDKGKPPTFNNIRKPDLHKFKAFVGNQSRTCLEGMAQ